MPPDRMLAEQRFRDLLDTGGIAQPDEVVHQDDQILFLWSSSKTAVVLELSSEPPPAEAA